MHSNHHLHKVAALGVSLAEALEYQEDYATQIIKNAKALAEGLWDRDMSVFASDYGFTESHTVLVDVSKHGGGADFSLRAESQGIIMNKNMLPGDTSAVYPSGIRLGTPELTRLGMVEDTMDEVAELISLVAIGGHDEEVRKRTHEIKTQYNTVKYCFNSGDKEAYAPPTFTHLN